jgi:hypothetical protein
VPDQQHADGHVGDGARDQHGLHADERQQDDPAQRHAHDGAQGVPGVHPADRRFTRAGTDQGAGDERQRHAGAEGGRQHDREAQGVARPGESDVAEVGAREGPHQRGDPIERRRVDRQRGERHQAHDPLHHPEGADRIADAVDSGADPERAERETQDEGGQHQLEGMRRTAQHQGQHPDPVDLIDEGGDRRSEAGEEEQWRERLGRQPAVLDRRALDRLSLGLRAVMPAPGCGDHAEGGERDDQVQHRRDQQGARKSGESHQIEPGHQHPDRGPETVGEIKEGERPSGLTAPETDDARAHERKGGAQEHRLRQDQPAGDGPLGHGEERRAGQRGIDGAVRQVGGPLVDLVEHQADQAHCELDEGVAPQRVLETLREAADHHGAGRHPAQEDH